MSTPSSAPTDKGVGWIVFAGMLMAFIGVLNIIYGAAALNSSAFFLGHGHLIISNLRTWGWVMIVLGAFQLLVALSIWEGGNFGKWVGIVFASLGALAAMMTIPAYPAWSLTLVALDVLVVYALAMYGGKGPETLA